MGMSGKIMGWVEKKYLSFQNKNKTKKNLLLSFFVRN